ncbi:outer membrane efflux protein [Candidatus Omnitrophus magneticus]|uniref:Outer membrane efflux protein n=1 Tax=Candidatus Omnitrophus magneticus TaxID=1609969 RepID=A0A0F0CSX5_9BACT|nr:outer membrane efflux protein [Candidatus Omnitrophus magneticus]
MKRFFLGFLNDLQINLYKKLTVKIHHSFPRCVECLDTRVDSRSRGNDKKQNGNDREQNGNNKNGRCLQTLASLFLSIALISTSFIKISFAKENTEISSARNSKSFSLETLFKLALKQSEVIAINREKIKEAEAVFTQALGTILPHVYFSRTDTIQNTDNPSYKKENFEQKFVFKQTLFAGFKEFAGMAGSKAEINQKIYEKKHAERALFIDVSDTFYLLLELEETFNTLEMTKKILNDRISELKKRVSLGKSRPSEISSTEVTLFNLEAEIESVKIQKTTATHLMEFLIGQRIEHIAEEEKSDINLKNITEYLKEIPNRPEILAAKYALDAARKKSYIAKTGFLPEVNLETNYYGHKTSMPRDTDWSALITLDIPIFEGLETIGAVKQANSEEKQMKLSYKETERNAIREINNLYSLVLISSAKLTAMSKALKSAEENYTFQTEDYKVNMVNNLDVLSAIETLETTRKNFYNVYYENRRYYSELRAAVGDIPQMETK